MQPSSAHHNDRVSIIGVPFNGGQPKDGVLRGPAAVRDAGLLSAVQALGLQVAYNEDVVIPPFESSSHQNAKNATWVGASCKRISEHTEQRRKEGDFVLSIGGDHSMAIGTISGLLVNHPDLFVVWVDAHADINTPQTTGSGNIHGMPLAFVTGLVGPLDGFQWRSDSSLPRLSLKNLAYIGLRDVDEGEKGALKEHKILAFSMSDVDRLGISEIMKQILIASAGKPIHVSFDIDALDPQYAPATGTPVLGGLSLREGRYICETLAQTRRLVSMDMAEVNPTVGDSEAAALTANSALLLIEHALGKTLL